MYVHAYQSYVWNAIVSERIKMHGTDKPVPGDLVFEVDSSEEVAKEDPEDGEPVVQEKEDGMWRVTPRFLPIVLMMNAEEEASGKRQKRAKKPWTPPQVKTLTEEDVDNYTIFDVIMPLPGRDVAYPGGALGERYREFLKMDGLDPDNWERKQRFVTSVPAHAHLLTVYSAGSTAWVDHTVRSSICPRSFPGLSCGTRIQMSHWRRLTKTSSSASTLP